MDRIDTYVRIVLAVAITLATILLAWMMVGLAMGVIPW